MKKEVMLIITAVALITIGIIFMKNGSLNILNTQTQEENDLVVINDTADVFSTAFTKGDKIMSQVVQPGQKATGGRGLLRIFIAQKNGNYELQYQYPRPENAVLALSLTQILKAVHNPELGQELYTEKGTIDDIKIEYEQVRDAE